MQMIVVFNHILELKNRQTGKRIETGALYQLEVVIFYVSYFLKISRLLIYENMY